MRPSGGLVRFFEVGGLALLLIAGLTIGILSNEALFVGERIVEDPGRLEQVRALEERLSLLEQKLNQPLPLQEEAKTISPLATRRPSEIMKVVVQEIVPAKPDVTLGSPTLSFAAGYFKSQIKVGDSTVITADTLFGTGDYTIGTHAGKLTLHPASGTVEVVGNLEVSGTLNPSALPKEVSRLGQTIESDEISDLDAAKLTGTIADARLSSNIPRLDAAANTFTGTLSIGSGTAISRILKGSCLVDPPRLTGDAVGTALCQAPGIIPGDVVSLTPRSPPEPYLWSVDSLASDTITIRFRNRAGMQDPPATTWDWLAVR